MLLLRRVIAALRGQGAAVALLAPATAAGALLGPGPSEVERVLDWERPDFAALLDPDVRLSARAADELAGFDVALVYSGSEALRSGMQRLIPRVLAHVPVPPRTMHASAWLALPLAELGIPSDAEPPPLAATEDERAQAAPWIARLPERFLAVHPGSGSPAKNWGAARHARLVPALAPRLPWLLVEGPADVEAARPLRALPSAVVARDLPLRVLGAVLSRCGLYVGNDSGVSHLAAAFGAPTLALFGPTDPAQWSPLGPRVQALRAPDGALDRLTLDEVLAAARAIFATGARSRRRDD